MRSSPGAGIAMALSVLAIAGCSDVTNVALCGSSSAAGSGACVYDPSPDMAYRYRPRAERDTLVVVTLSGGGMRAAALSYGVLETLDKLPGIYDENEHLLDDVDIISSVSGGSVTAAWYALRGHDGIAHNDDSNALWTFLHRRWTANLAVREYNPFMLARYAVTPYSRSDLLADFFDDALFARDGTSPSYADVLKLYHSDPHQPFVILNATDLGHESGFAFTQGRFDLLCSDLTPYRLADAVAASANFPIAFSALGLENFFASRSCAAEVTSAWQNAGPPQWYTHYDKFDMPEGAPPRSYQFTELRAARQAEDYIHAKDHTPADQYVHLLDGGLIDNLGVRSTLDIEDDPARVPGLYVRLGPSRPKGYENIKRVLYIVVNARTRDPASIDGAKYPPGLITTPFDLIDTQLDNSVLTDEAYVISELEATQHNDFTGTFLSKSPDAGLKYPAPKDNDGKPILLAWSAAFVDFEMIAQKPCRDHYWRIGTNWGLDDNDITGLLDLPEAILSGNLELHDFYASVDRDRPALHTLDKFNNPTWKPKTLADVCGP